jgi:tetratricopeptide (TPR) repeat protein
LVIALLKQVVFASVGVLCLWTVCLFAQETGPSGGADAVDSPASRPELSQSSGVPIPPQHERIEDAIYEISTFGFEQALEIYEELLPDAREGSLLWQQVIFGMGVCHQQNTPFAEINVINADRCYRQLLKKVPDSVYAPRAIMNLGRIAEMRDFQTDEIDLVEARSWYNQVIKKWPDQPIAGEATLRLAATYIKTLQKQQIPQGIAILEKWLDTHPDDPLAAAMWQYLGDTYFFPMEQYQKSLDAYVKADRIGLLEKGRKGPVYWRMAVMAERLVKDRDRAVEYYTKIIEIVPTSGKAYESQLALKRLGAPVPPLEITYKQILKQDEADNAAQAPQTPTTRENNDE